MYGQDLGSLGSPMTTAPANASPVADPMAAMMGMGNGAMGGMAGAPEGAQQANDPRAEIQMDFTSAISTIQDLARKYPALATQINQALQLLLETMVNGASMMDPMERAAKNEPTQPIGPGPQTNPINSIPLA